MDEFLQKMQQVLTHLQCLHTTFKLAESIDETNATESGEEAESRNALLAPETNEESAGTEPEQIIATQKSPYEENSEKLDKELVNLGFYDQLYGRKGRQMILADFLEYIFLSRGIYSVKKDSLEQRGQFIKATLYFVNMLMCLEELTVSAELRKTFLKRLEQHIDGISEEPEYDNLLRFEDIIGLPASTAPSQLSGYFDTLLPKTAGGLWHELLVYIFLVRKDYGFVIPLLLTQRFMGRKSYLVPPDFLLLTHDKNLYGIEVGNKKEIQSGTFSLQTTIPTATVDTENSRTSDRCPICKNWIEFCPHVINVYSDLEKAIPHNTVKCLESCTIYRKEDGTVDTEFISQGNCRFTKYSRQHATTLQHTHHEYANGWHYHYGCVLENAPETTKQAIIEAKDTVALKTHFPHYAGLEALEKEKQ